MLFVNRTNSTKFRPAKMMRQSYPLSSGDAYAMAIEQSAHMDDEAVAEQSFEEATYEGLSNKNGTAFGRIDTLDRNFCSRVKDPALKTACDSSHHRISLFRNKSAK